MQEFSEILKNKSRIPRPARIYGKIEVYIYMEGVPLTLWHLKISTGLLYQIKWEKGQQELNHISKASVFPFKEDLCITERSQQ